MRVQIWGCAWSWFVKGDPTNYIDIRNCSVGISSSRTVTKLEPLETMRILQVNLSKEEKEGRPVSPIWLTFGGTVEAEQFLHCLKEAIEAYKKNEDYDCGTVPVKVIIDPSVF